MPELTVLIMVLVWGAADAVGRARHAERVPVVVRRPVPTVCFYLGVLAVLVALEGPLDRAAGTSETWHMAQHVVLLMVAAPLLVLGAPMSRLAWAVPRSWERRIRRSRVARSVLRATPALAVVAVALQSAALAGWHLPGPYQAAVRNPPLHACEHAVFLGTGVFLWWVLVHTSRARLGAGVLALFIAALPATALGVMMTFARTSWYPVYGTGAAALGDQQLAGVVMWSVGNTVSVIAAVALFAAWLASLERATPARPAVPARS